MALAAALAAATTAFTTIHLSRPAISLTRTTHRHLRTIITASSSTDFNITFAPPKPKPKPAVTPSPSSDHESPAMELPDQLYIPWIVRDEKGNLTLQSTPPAHLLKAMAVAETRNKKKKEKVKAKRKVVSDSQPAAASTGKPKLSKAARRYYNDTFRDPPQRLNKVLAAAGVASRRSSDELIKAGKVTVNGSVCDTPQTKVDPLRDVVYVEGKRLPKRLPPKVYFALNKPKGYICSAGEKEKKSVLMLFDDFMTSWDKMNSGLPRPRLFTVGRLDVATTGLMLVTNDGDFAQKLSHPSSNMTKEYIATIDGAIHKQHLITIGEGTVVDGVKCVPELVELLPSQPDISRPRIRIVVNEGRNHEVRELVKSAGLEVHALKRVRIGGFRLPSDLGLGKHIELKPSSLRALGWKS